MMQQSVLNKFALDPAGEHQVFDPDAIINTPRQAEAHSPVGSVSVGPVNDVALYRLVEHDLLQLGSLIFSPRDISLVRAPDELPDQVEIFGLVGADIYADVARSEQF